MSGSTLHPVATCRRCTECTGEAHHWRECGLLEAWNPASGEPAWGCKHCDYTCAGVECEACGEDIPVDVAAVDTAHAIYLCPSCVGDA